MRVFIHCVLLAVPMVMLAGCGSGKHTESAAQTKPPENTKACVMQSGGQDVLRLAAPADTECVAKDGSLKLNSEHRAVQIWLVSGAQSVDDALGRVSDVIKDEFKNFKVTKSTDLKIAGTAAKQQEGSGEEADDGDPGLADVIVFKIGEHVFVACTHGEALNPAAQEWMTKLVQGAKGP